MRVGIATALTLADIAELPLIGLDSLQVLAHGVERVALQELDDAEIVVPILDARRNQVYWSMHRIDHSTGGALEEIREPRVGEVEELIEDLLDRSQRSVVLGTGAVKYIESLIEIPDLALLGERSGVRNFAFNAHLPHASTLVSLAAKNYAAGRLEGSPIAPIYLRAPDAEIQWLTR
jgi:tRNA threonylcarbamoyladenosine biosynthesis protein TsaB